MTTFLIVAGVIIFIIYLFQSDKKEVKTKNQKIGGLAKRFPNFVAYTKQAYTTSDPYLQFVKDDGQFLEYRFPVKGNYGIAGYFHLGLENVFGTFAYCFAINSSGKKIEGFIREIHNGRNYNIPEDKTIEDYSQIFDSLITQMEHIRDFDEKFYSIKS